MTWTLISYSEVKVPLLPYRLDYIIGIAENKRGQHLMVQIDKEHVKELSIGISGDIKIAKGPNGEINVFVPTYQRQKEDIVNKVALITGSSRGIGRAIAIELAKSGIDIVVNNNIDSQEGIEVVDEIEKIGQQAIHILADVSDPDQVEKMIEKIIKKFGRIDILINNAGIVMDKMLENMDIDQWNKVISVNLTGTFNCTKSVIKHMQKKGGGKIINISSIIGEIGNIGQSNYSASKGGIISFTKSIAKEYARDGITVNAIAPGFIDTEMTRKIPENIKSKILEQIPMRRFATPEEIAYVVLFLCNASYITGTVIDVNGGMR